MNIITEAGDGGLVSGQAHPAHHSRSGGADGPLAVVDAVAVSFVQALQVRPEGPMKLEQVLDNVIPGGVTNDSTPRLSQC